MSPLANFWQLLQLLPTAHPLLLKHAGFHFFSVTAERGYAIGQQVAVYIDR
jgi:hypothetical protein